MSEENKSNDFMDDAKEGAKKAADKAEEFAKEATTDAKEALSDGKNVAIIAHITIIGWVIALIMNNNKKDEFASFYIRQMLGLMILGLILNFIPGIGQILSIVVLILWILSLIGAIGGKKSETPAIGKYFQDWFNSL